MYAAELKNTGREKFDDCFNAFEARELARRILRAYIREIDSDIDRETCMWLHIDRIGKQAVNEDIAETLACVDLQEAESLYGSRVGMAAARGRCQGNHSSLRCFVREVRRARRMMIGVAKSGAF